VLSVRKYAQLVEVFLSKKVEHEYTNRIKIMSNCDWLCWSLWWHVM